MTAAKVAITLPEEQLAQIKQAVRKGRAGSVSAYISHALARQAREESLRELLDDLISVYGPPAKKDVAWARAVLHPKRQA